MGQNESQRETTELEVHGGPKQETSASIGDRPELSTTYIHRLPSLPRLVSNPIVHGTSRPRDGP
jgi:hypothetical protein